MVHRLYLVAGIVLPVLAAWAGRWVPLSLLLPCAFGLAIALHLAHRHRVLAAARPTGRGGGAEPVLDLYEYVEERLEGLQAELRSAQLERVQGNIRLLGLGEMWRSLSASEELGEIFSAVLRYCRHEGQFREVALLRLDGEHDALAGHWYHPGLGPSQTLPVRWNLGGIGGAVLRVIEQPRSLLAPQSSLEPVITINRERPEPRTRFRNFAIVPIMGPRARPECAPENWLHKEGCPAFQPARFARGEERGGRLAPCSRCTHYPFFGLLLVTDAGRPDPLRRSDLLMLESVAAAVATAFERSRLSMGVRRSERLRQRTLESMDAGLISTDALGIIRFANRQAIEMAQLPEAELLGMRLDRLLRFPDDTAFPRVLSQGRAARHLEAALGKAQLPVRVNLAPLPLEAGGHEGAVVVFEDLSGLRAMEEEIRQLDNLAAVGRFASSMAHEIRNPLGGVSAGIGYLARRQGVGEAERENLALMQGEVERVDRLIGDLLGVARPREMRLEPESPRHLVERAVAAVGAIARERGVELHHDLPDGLPELNVDADMVHQLLLNLLKNAVELSPRGATVELAVEHAGDGLAFEVRDRGPGFGPDEIVQAFEPFFSRKAGGTGLGLYVCHNFAERHGGRLKAANRPGGGAILRLDLPITPALLGAKP